MLLNKNNIRKIKINYKYDVVGVWKCKIRKIKKDNNYNVIKK